MRIYITFLFSLFLGFYSAFSQCGLNEKEYFLDIYSSSNAKNTSWSILDDSDNLVSFGFQLNDNDTFQESFCLKEGDYSFKISEIGSHTWAGSYSLKNSANQSIISGSGANAMAPAAFLVQGIHPCQDIQGSVSFNLPPDTDFNNIPNGDTITVCYDVNLQSLLNFPENNANYNQSITNVSYLWEVSNPAGVSDGQTSTTSTAYFTFDDFFTYKVNLTVTDTNDCEWGYEFFVKNSSANTFIDLTVDNNLICIGDTTMIHASHSTEEPITEVVEPEPIFLDDVVGGQYLSVININNFHPDDTLVEDCIERVCAEMEHTWAGDLTIFLTLPSGDTIDFVPDLNGGGNGNGFSNVDMGIPEGGSDPGTPFLYCWTPTAGITMHDYALSGAGASVFPETVINADGTYTNDYNANPDNGNGWDNAIGSPINGDWTFHIIDTWGGDDGFIFGWDFKLCSEAAGLAFVDSFWVGPTGGFATNDDADSLSRVVVGVASPTNSMNFEYHIVDNNGCEWVEDITINTSPLPIINAGATVKCNDVFEIGVTDNANITGSWTYEAPTGVTDPVNFNPGIFDLSPVVTVPEVGIYTFYYTSECGSVDSQVVNFESFSPGDVTPSYDTVYCENEFQLAAGNATGTPGEWHYLVPPGAIDQVIFTPDAFALTPTITVPGLGTYDFTYETECGVTEVQSITFVGQAPELDIELTQNCDFEIDLAVTTTGLEGDWTVTSPTGGTAVIADPTALTTTAEVSDYGQYTFTFTFDFCESSFSQTMEVVSVAPVIVQDQEIFVCDSEIELEAIVEGQIVGWKILEGPGIVNFSAFESANTSATFSEYGTYVIEFTGCGGADTISVVFEKMAPNFGAPEYVTCGLQALVEVGYLGEPGTWSAVGGNNETIDLDIQSDPNQVIISSDIYGSAEVTYTVCDTSVTREIVFMCDLEVPNVFTPNDDAYNSHFTIPRLSKTFYDRSTFTVYDKWGVQVYYNGEYGLNGTFWNGRKDNTVGKELPEGVYFYVLSLHNKINDLEENYKGSIHLFR